MNRILLTCPPMIGLADEFRPDWIAGGLDVVIPQFTQVMEETDLIEIIDGFDGWIIGDDPATRAVFEAGVAGRLKAAVKWGVGVDNVDFAACRDLSIPITNTPGVFGREVADVAMTYLVGLARETYRIDREIRQRHTWPKPAGISLWNKTALVVGFGDIGRQVVKRMLAHDLRVLVSDPARSGEDIPDDVEMVRYEQGLAQADFVVFCVPLNSETHHMFDMDALEQVKPGIRLINVSRGPVVQEKALVEGLEKGLVHSAALDVFEVEPLPEGSGLRQMDRCIFGSHNGSNTVDAVRRVSKLATEKLIAFLDDERS